MVESTTNPSNNETTPTKKPLKRLAVAYPVVKPNGSEFANLQELTSLLDSEPDGRYLISGRLWHGGVHFSDINFQHHCFVPNTNESSNESNGGTTSDTVYPLRCIMDGEIIAYRMNETVKGTDGPAYHCSFVLVKHTYRAGEKDESEVVLYSHYMNLCSFDVYRQLDSDKTNSYETLKTINLYENAENILIKPLGQTKKGDKFSYTNNNPVLKAVNGKERPFDVVTFIDGAYKGKTCWMVIDEKDTNYRQVETPSIMPNWLHTLSNPQPEQSEPPSQELVLDNVTILEHPIPIKAGEGIGHMGLMPRFESMGESTNEKYGCHIELFTDDGRVETFINQVDKLTEEEYSSTVKYLLYSPNCPTYTVSSDDVATVSQRVLTVGNITPLAKVTTKAIKTGETSKNYYFLEEEKVWLCEDDVQKISQYDFKAQGFEIIESASRELIEFGIDTAPSGFVKQVLTYLKSRFEEKMYLSSQLDVLAIQRVINHYQIYFTTTSPYISIICSIRDRNWLGRKST